MTRYKCQFLYIKKLSDLFCRRYFLCCPLARTKINHGSLQVYVFRIGNSLFALFLLLLNLFSCLHMTPEVQEIPEAYIHLYV
jgi:hypothetical protein